MPRGMGGPHGRNMAGEKAKDFKGTIKKLIRYMSAFKVHMFFVAVFVWTHGGHVVRLFVVPGSVDGCVAV